jgi:hypothetical protein
VSHRTFNGADTVAAVQPRRCEMFGKASSNVREARSLLSFGGELRRTGFPMQSFKHARSNSWKGCSSLVYAFPVSMQGMLQ